MKMLDLTILLLAVPLVCFANAAETPQLDDIRSEPAIAKLLPADYANFKSRIRGDHGLGDAKASIQLLLRVKDHFGSPPSDEAQLRALRNAYHGMWRICLREFQGSNDESARQIILDNWNESLKPDGDAVPSQIYALIGHWDRRLLTDPFWHLLKDSKTPRTVASICYVLYLCGDRHDVERLETRLKGEANSTLGELIANAVNYMNWRLSGSKGPGPAAMPPRLVE